MVDLNRIKEVAKIKGWSMSFLCKKLDLSASYFTDVRNGKTVISDERTAIIADLLNTTPEYLKGETDIKEKPSGEEAEGLSEEDRAIMELLNSLPENKKKRALRVLDLLLNEDGSDT